MRKRSTNIRDALADKVEVFLSRAQDGNSGMLPGKKDGKGIGQIWVLNDYMKNLQLKFLVEFLEIKVPQESFRNSGQDMYVFVISYQKHMFMHRTSKLCT